MTTSSTDAQTPQTSATPDLIDTLAGLAPDSHARQLRLTRKPVALATQACDDLIYSPALAGGLSVAERLQAAHAVAQAGDVAALSRHYADRLHALGQRAEAPDRSERLLAITAFARTVAQDPLAADRQALATLADNGLTVPEIVMLGQLVGYVAYQARLLAGIVALAELGPVSETSPALPADAPQVDADFVHPANLPAPGEALDINGYTSRTLDWKAWLKVVDPQTATASQNAILDASHPKARSSDFYLLLAHQPDVLAQRSAAFNAIMYAPGGLSRAERELASAAVSRVNGCVYCLSVHAQRFEQLAKRNDVMVQLFTDPQSAGTNARERAIVQFAAALTQRPGRLQAADLQAMRQAGLSDQEMLDALHASALFAWANRLMLNLGEAVYPAA